MEWEELVSRLLSEPKPPLRFWARKLSPERRALDEAKVVHDGKHAWLIKGQARAEINNGQTAVVVGPDGTAEAHLSRELHSFGWLKSLVHPRLLRFASARSTGSIVRRERIRDREVIEVSATGLREDEPGVEFRMAVDAATGVILRVRRPDGAAVELVDARFGVEPDRALFEWTASIDVDHRTGGAPG